AATGWSRSIGSALGSTTGTGAGGSACGCAITRPCTSMRRSASASSAVARSQARVLIGWAFRGRVRSFLAGVVASRRLFSQEEALQLVPVGLDHQACGHERADDRRDDRTARTGVEVGEGG